MSQDSLMLVGQIKSDSGNFSTDGAGNLNVATLAAAQQTGTVSTIAGAGTITVGTSGGNGSLRVTAAGAVTGVILTAGTRAGQKLSIIHEGAAANTITFAASGTSNIADGTSAVLAGLRKLELEWDASTSLWYRS